MSTVCIGAWEVKQHHISEQSNSTLIHAPTATEADLAGMRPSVIGAAATLWGHAAMNLDFTKWEGVLLSLVDDITKVRYVPSHAALALSMSLHTSAIHQSHVMALLLTEL